MKKMEHPIPVKVEDEHKFFIDVDINGSSPEDIIIEWHMEIRRLFGQNVAAAGETELVKIMKAYVTAISDEAIHFEDIEKLLSTVDKHMEHIYWLYLDLNLCYSDTYLDYMEHILTFYVNLTLRVLLALKIKTKVTQKMVHDMTQKVIKRLSSYLFKSEYHILHVLIRQTTTLADNMVKDVMNILNSNICKQMFKNLYMHFLVLTPLRDTSDEAFCRAFILFENWKAFDDYKQNEKIDECIRNLFKRGVECIRDNAFLRKILQPQASIITQLLKVVGCDPSITKAYFDYITSKTKLETDILNDIEKLALVDVGSSGTDWDDDDEDDLKYKELFDRMMGEAGKKAWTVAESLEVKKEKSPIIGNAIVDDPIEIINCDSDSDSDLEIVSITPSDSSNAAGNKSGIDPFCIDKKNGPKLSFLDSISIDFDTITSRRKKLSKTQEKSQSNRSSPKINLDSNQDLVVLSPARTDEPMDTAITEEQNTIDESLRGNCEATAFSKMPSFEVPKSPNSSIPRNETDVNCLVSESRKEHEDLSAVQLKKTQTLDVQMESLKVTKDPCGQKMDDIQTHIDHSTPKINENPTASNIEDIVLPESNLPSQTTDAVEQSNISINDHNERGSEATCSVFQQVTETTKDTLSRKLEVAARDDTEEKNHELQSVENLPESYQVDQAPSVEESHNSVIDMQIPAATAAPKLYVTGDKQMNSSCSSRPLGVKSGVTDLDCSSDVSLASNDYGIKIKTVFDMNNSDKLPSSNNLSKAIVEQPANSKNGLVQLKQVPTSSPDEIAKDTQKPVKINGSHKTTKQLEQTALIVIYGNRCSGCSKEEKINTSEKVFESATNHNTSNARVNGQTSQSLFLDTGQCVSSQTLDTGQGKESASKSSSSSNIVEVDTATISGRTISDTLKRHYNSEKRTASTVSEVRKAETCVLGYLTPPGSDGDVDKDASEQPDPTYSNMPTHSMSYSDESNPEDEICSPTVEESTGETLTAHTPVVITNEQPDEILVVVPEPVHTESVNSEITTGDLDILISPEDARLRQETSVVENEVEPRNPVLGKTYEEIVRDTVGSQDEEEDNPTTYVQIAENAATKTPSSPSYSAIADEMEQFLRENDPAKSCKRLKHSPPKSKKKLTIVTTIENIPSSSFDDFDIQMNRQTANANNANDSTTVEESNSSDSDSIPLDRRRKKKGKSTAKQKPSEMPLSKYRTRKNGIKTSIPLSTGTSSATNHPPLKGILKKVEQKHTYQPLHPVDDESEAVVHIQVKHKSDKRGMVGTRMVKIYRKSFTAYKVSTDDFKLCHLYAIAKVERLSPNTLLVWERVSKRSRESQCEASSTSKPHAPMYKIVFDKRTPGLNSNDRVFFCEPLNSHESKAPVELQNANLEPGTVNDSSTEIACIETPIPVPEGTISPCLSPSSKSSSEFSDSINLIPYQDIERALQVVEPDKSGSNGPNPCENVDVIQHDSNDILDRTLVDNISVETIQLLSNNADFHKMFCDLDGEILIENVPVLDTEETESILNGTGSFIKPHSKVVDIRLSDKLSDDLILNLNADEHILKKVCQELESNSLVDALEVNSTSTESCIVPNDYLDLQFTEDSRSSSNFVDENRSPLSRIPSRSKFYTEAIVGGIKHEPASNAAFLNSSNISLTAPIYPVETSHEKSNRISRKRLPKEILSINSQLNSPMTDEDWIRTNTNLGRPVSSSISQESQPLSLISGEILQPYQSSQAFHNSRVDQSFWPNPQKPSLMVNLPIPQESLEALSKRKFSQRSSQLVQKATENIPPTHPGIELTPAVAQSLYDTANSQEALRAVESIQQGMGATIHHIQYAEKVQPPKNGNILITNAFILHSDEEQKLPIRRRGRPPKVGKKPKETPPIAFIPPPHYISPTMVPNHPYHDRVPVIYHSESECIQRFLNSSQKEIDSKTPENLDDISSKISSENGRKCVNTRYVAATEAETTPLPMPVPHTFNFETDTLKNEIYNKVDSNENEVEFETHLPLKKRKLSMPIPSPLVSVPATSSSSNSSLSSGENKSNEISYPATPMLSIADVYIPPNPRSFKTPAEKKQLPPDSSVVPIRYDPAPEPVPFTCSMNTFSSSIYRLNECPYNVKMDCSAYCPPPVLFPTESFGRSN